MYLNLLIKSLTESQALRGFTNFTVLVEKRGHQAKAAATQARMSTLFFENHALGIMNNFSTIIDNRLESLANKRRSLTAIGQLISAGQGNVAVALPQVGSMSARSYTLRADHTRFELVCTRQCRSSSSKTLLSSLGQP